jgi:hypothetical protein
MRGFVAPRHAARADGARRRRLSLRQMAASFLARLKANLRAQSCSAGTPLVSECHSLEWLAGCQHRRAESLARRSRARTLWHLGQRHARGFRGGCSIGGAPELHRTACV